MIRPTLTVTPLKYGTCKCGRELVPLFNLTLHYDKNRKDTAGPLCGKSIGESLDDFPRPAFQGG